MFKKIKGILRIIRNQYSRVRIPEEKITIKQKTINNYKILVLANEDVGRQIYFEGSYEKTETEFISNIIKKDNICIDIGANVGYYTLLMASKAVEGKVYSLEPTPLHFYLLNCNKIINNFNNVICNNCAIGNINGEMDFSIASDGAFSSFKNTKRKFEVKKIKVPIVTLDNYIKDNRIDKDFIKIDVEGAEKMVLEGASKLLQDNNCRPRAMMIELYDPNLKVYNTNIEDVVTYMRKNYEYKAFVLYKKEMIPFKEKYYNKIYNVFFALNIDSF